MAFPIFPEKVTGREITGPATWAGYITGLGRFADFQAPGLMIFTWQKSFYTWIKSRYAHRAQRDFPGEVILLNGRMSHEGYGEGGEPSLGVAYGFGIGAPAAVFMMEALAALGVRRFLGLGTAGGLGGGDDPLRVGDVLLADGSFRDEGTSYHYLAEGKEALPDGEETDRLEGILRLGKYPYRRGSVWSTDAFFRETEEELLYYRSRGALAVDMEGAALYACARMRGLSMASLFVISDILTREGWAPDFHLPRVGNTLRSLLTDVTGLS